MKLEALHDISCPNPNPTNFSNMKSEIYLSSPEKYSPNLAKCKITLNSRVSGKSVSPFSPDQFENPFEKSKECLDSSTVPNPFRSSQKFSIGRKTRAITSNHLFAGKVTGRHVEESAAAPSAHTKLEKLHQKVLNRESDIYLRCSFMEGETEEFPDPSVVVEDMPFGGGIPLPPPIGQKGIGIEMDGGAIKDKKDKKDKIDGFSQEETAQINLLKTRPSVNKKMTKCSSFDNIPKVAMSSTKPKEVGIKGGKGGKGGKLMDKPRESLLTASPTKFFIDLEKLIQIENSCWSLLEGLRFGIDVIVYCQTWWDLTQDFSFSQLQKLYKEGVRRALHKYFLLETISYALTQFVMSDPQISQECLIKLKNVFFNIHQNFLILITFIVDKLPFDTSQNVWAQSLEALIISKQPRKFLKGEKFSQLRQNNRVIFSILLKICQCVQKMLEGKENVESKLITEVQNILKNLEKYPIKKARGLIQEELEESLKSLEQQKITCETEAPYLPPILPTAKPYTLILDLDETLVHYLEKEDSGEVLVRPYCEEFLEEMAKYYELVIFTAALQDYADWVLDQLDPARLISYRLYRHHVVNAGPVYIKDISRVGRDLGRSLIVDNICENFQWQPDNGIQIISWYGDQTDNALEELGYFLKDLAQREVVDVRKALSDYVEQLV